MSAAGKRLGINNGRAITDNRLKSTSQKNGPALKSSHGDSKNQRKTRTNHEDTFQSNQEARIPTHLSPILTTGIFTVTCTVIHLSICYGKMSHPESD